MGEWGAQKVQDFLITQILFDHTNTYIEEFYIYKKIGQANTQFYKTIIGD